MNATLVRNGRIGHLPRPASRRIATHRALPPELTGVGAAMAQHRHLASALPRHRIAGLAWLKTAMSSRLDLVEMLRIRRLSCIVEEPRGLSGHLRDPDSRP
ncbi:hypothetical protein NON19_12230 [Streptomyces rubrisoli]|uniref:Uncharacterized protein n=1 Tax=Streptantibioticus rubrisoli TaxID=1387313 RepID=A0ABT1PBM1_9ACTN|nr:hypothetical protein [Streptantibioticus rubrisoli]